MSLRKNRKPWPENCLWPEPTEWGFGYDEESIPDELDEDAQDLLDVKEYYDELKEQGILRPDYQQKNPSTFSFDDLPESTNKWIKSLAADYWDNGFDYDTWRDDLSAHLSLLKIDLNDSVLDLFCQIRNITEYTFVNENLLRQAFTRRAFAIEYGLEGMCGRPGCCEELEFLGDSIINSVVTKEIIRQFTENNCNNVEVPFESRFDEGEMTRIREHFVGKDHLSGRIRELGLGNYILYGSDEKENDSSLEDLAEALVGAIAVDCGFDNRTLERVVNELLYIQLDTPDHLLKKSYYEKVNGWHQKNFGKMPVYEVHARLENDSGYDADIRFYVPENEKGIYTAQRLIGEGRTRSLAREDAARAAYRFVVNNGLWSRLSYSGIIPDPENSINQLQELYQKKYLEDAPTYRIEERENDHWSVICIAGGVSGYGEAGSKVKAKKIAAYEVLSKLFAEHS